jgi:hypothetical protein
MLPNKPLKDLIPSILSHVANWKSNMEFNFRLYKILEGQIRKEIEDSLQKELISKQAYTRAIERIPSLNILKRTTDKLSKIYVESPQRKALNKTDIEIMNNISKECSIDVVMDMANKYYNSMFSFALEPYIEDSKHQLRILAPHQFLVYSDSHTDRSKHTVFIKMLGTRTEFHNVTRVTTDGKRQDTEKRPSVVEIMALYTDKEFMIIDSNGGIREDIMKDMGFTDFVNPFGQIPFIYGKRTLTELIPYPNQPGFDFSVLIPKLLTDLNYAAQFASHSITWVRNVAPGGVKEYNPDAIIDLGSGDTTEGQPEIGTIKPEVDVEQQLSLIEFQFGAHLDSLGIKTNTTGTMSNGRDVSGIAKAIDEGDISAEKKTQTKYFTKIETELWQLISKMQNVWKGRKDVAERRVFSSEFPNQFSIEFCEIKPMKSFQQTIEEVKSLKELGLIGPRQSIKRLFPQWSDEEVNTYMKDLDKEKEKQMQDMMEVMAQNGTTLEDNSGQFKEGNTAGANQTIESRSNEIKS